MYAAAMQSGAAMARVIPVNGLTLSDSHTAGMVVKEVLFRTEAQARRYVDEALLRYHPCGYGTRTIVKRTLDGWTAFVSRFASCD